MKPKLILFNDYFRVGKLLIFYKQTSSVKEFTEFFLYLASSMFHNVPII